MIATNLEWSHTLCDSKRVDYSTAEAACAALGPGWRVPERYEQESILDLTRYEPAIDTTRFPDTQSDWYWSSTPCAWSPGCAWIVHFYAGYVDSGHRRSDLAFVRAVRSVPVDEHEELRADLKALREEVDAQVLKEEALRLRLALLDPERAKTKETGT